MLKRYRIFSILLIVITCLSVSLFYLQSMKKITAIYIENTHKSIYNLKKEFLCDTINNQIARIDEMRANTTKAYQDQAQEIEYVLQVSRDTSPQEFTEMFRNYFAPNGVRAIWEVALWETATGRVLYDPQNLINGKSPAKAIKLIQKEYAVYKTAPYGTCQTFFGVKKSSVDAQTKKMIAAEIHNSRFAENSYIWVNEVLNYDGGRNYAIRRVHPNLPETEGMFLSTDMTDIKGGFPYRAELEGIKKHGECFNSYYFKKMNSEIISEKLTYAKLYEDFNWVVAMGIHLDDLNAYVDKTNDESRQLVLDLLKIMILLLLIIMGASFAFLVLLGRGSLRKTKQKMREEVNYDLLTKAFSRRAGDRDLIRRWANYLETGISPVIIYFDVDNFKNINDRYGHHIGDEVLIKTVQAVKGAVRTTDKLYRWGGDEFILVCEGINRENTLILCNKILQVVNDINYHANGEHVATTISMGATLFQESDRDYNDAIQRADKAVYISKSQGRNQVNIQ